IIGHIIDNNGLLIRKVKIGDHAWVDALSLIMPGVEIGDRAVIGAQAMVSVGTIINPYEYWAGTPARKIKDLHP
ncbi:MAG: hypothetical protein Q7U40_13555, partial [Desulfatirhabdiaceae bacterium]|nr:hypothetical protein [Desulfatirhabdiaceae bacterium]